MEEEGGIGMPASLSAQPPVRRSHKRVLLSTVPREPTPTRDIARLAPVIVLFLLVIYACELWGKIETEIWGQWPVSGRTASYFMVLYWPFIHSGRYGCYLGRSRGNTIAVWALWQYRIRCLRQRRSPSARWYQRRTPKYTDRVTYEMELSVYGSFIYGLTAVILYILVQAGYVSEERVAVLCMDVISVPTYGGWAYLGMGDSLLGQIGVCLVIFFAGFVRGHAGGAYFGRLIDVMRAFWRYIPGGILIYFESLEESVLLWRINQQAGRVLKLPNGTALYEHYGQLCEEVNSYQEPREQLAYLTAYLKHARACADGWSQRPEGNTPKERIDINASFVDFHDNIVKAALIGAEKSKGQVNAGREQAATRQGGELGKAFSKIDPWKSSTPSGEPDGEKRSCCERLTSVAQRWKLAFLSLPLAGEVLLLLAPIGFFILMGLLYQDKMPYFVTAMWGQFSSEQLEAFREKYPGWFFFRAVWWSLALSSQTANYIGKLLEYFFKSGLQPSYEVSVSRWFSIIYAIFGCVWFMLRKRLIIYNELDTINAHFYGTWYFLGDTEETPEGKWALVRWQVFLIVEVVLILRGHADGAYIGRVIDSHMRVRGGGDMSGEGVVFLWQSPDGVLRLARAHHKLITQAQRLEQAAQKEIEAAAHSSAEGSTSGREEGLVNEGSSLLPAGGEMQEYGATIRPRQITRADLIALATFYQALADVWTAEKKDSANKFSTMFTFIQQARAKVTQLSRDEHITITHEQRMLLECDVLGLLRELEVFLVQQADQYLPQEYEIVATSDSNRLFGEFERICHTMLGVSVALAV